ncbi:MAG: site-specific DNA-methyltransferase [Nitrospirae bacterium]|nr:site-specific DNA-methyltransferase [Nitrospirota bacterium]MBF0554816.1 site-specific DNA-methyltransferase [Nitrospirota bacterium]
MKRELPVNTIYKCDSAIFLQRIVSRSIHLIVTSPPYNDARSYTHEFNVTVFHLEKILMESCRVLVNGGVFAIVVGDTVVNKSETGLPARIVTFMLDYCHMTLHDTMIFEKNSSGHRESNRYQQVFEFVLVFSKYGAPRTFTPLRDHPIKSSKPWGTRTFRQYDGSLCETERKTYNNDFDVRRNIWKYSVGGRGVASTFKRVSEHPATCPDRLPEDLILTWSERGDIVMDPFCGSGTTCAMAKKHGRLYLGCDISEQFCELSRDRINNTVTLEPEDDNNA